MIKRQDYRLLHLRSNDDASSSSSSHESSLSEKADSEDEVESVQSPDDEDFGEESSLREPKQSPSSGGVAESGRGNSQWAEAVEETEKDRVRDSIDDSVVLRTGQNQGVLKCRLCPKTVCFSEDTMRSHLSSNGHSRAVSRFAQGKLKVVLNSDGEEESADEGETHAERHSRIMTAMQQVPQEKVTKKQSGRQRQRLRAKKKAEAAAKKQGKASTAEKTKPGFLHVDISSQGKTERRNGHQIPKDKTTHAVATSVKLIDSMKKRSREGRSGGEKSKKRKKSFQK